MEVFGYRKLKVYHKALEWVIRVYGLVRRFPKEEQYALCDQVRRAAVSVTSNIAEGMSRSSDKEVAHFLEISYGSLMEVQSQIEVALGLGYIINEDVNSIEPLTEEIAKMLSGLRASRLSSNNLSPKNLSSESSSRLSSNNLSSKNLSSLV